MRFSPKKLLLMTGLAAMALSFAACGKKEAKTASDASESTVAGSADSNLPKEPKSYGKRKTRRTRELKSRPMKSA